MAHIDERMLFVDLTREQAEELREYGEAILIHGDVPAEMPALVQEWLDRQGVLPGQQLLYLSTVLPGRLQKLPSRHALFLARLRRGRFLLGLLGLDLPSHGFHDVVAVLDPRRGGKPIHKPACGPYTEGYDQDLAQ